ncbi:MAG TPA: flagellar basal body P-ring protein FlgI [Gemmataceae bacterium]|nr:flagellar basal body P-ring protein FlgI [Gemmataceae bacterium]
MIQRTSAGRGLGVFTTLLGLVAAGCLHQQTRLQSEDDSDRAETKYEIKTIGDVTTVAGVEPLPVGGVGLVVDLDGTGGDAPPGGYRTMLETQLKKEGVQNVREVLASPSTSLVLVSAQIPAGARKGDPIDLEITLPPGSKTTSLRGGYLRKCYLYSYDTTKNLLPTSRGADRPLLGHPLVVAEGRLLVGLGDGDEEARLRRGRIWGGGRCRINRPFELVLNSDKQYASLAAAVADRINHTFHGSFPRSPGDELAVAKNNTHVLLGVPPQYRLNLPRYLRVVRLIPLREAAGAAALAERNAYRQRLEKDLLDPDRCVIAALRLEALGNDTVPALKEGLKSPHALVRFCAAEALAYMNQSAAGEVLADMVEQQPALRAFSLTALASLDEAVCHIKLRELLASPDAETRYGAFRALRALDERDEAVQGELLNDSFWLHKVAPGSPPLVHMTSGRRAEIVLFGEEAYLKPPFQFLAGDFAITADEHDERCTISRFTVNRPPARRQCSLKLEDVLRTLAGLGGGYPEAVELLRQVETCGTATCRVMADALPQAVSVYELVRAGQEIKKREQKGTDLAREEPTEQELLKRDEEIVRSRLDLGATPNLFARDPARRPRLTPEPQAEAAARDRPPPADRAPWRR